jgi:hypothetical protein
MNREEKILSEVEKTLKAIDTLPKIEGNPFLFTRVKARIVNESIKPGVKEKTDFVLKPVTLAVLILINVITAAYFIGLGNNSSSSTSLVNSMKQEYGVTQIQSDNFNLE